MTTFAEAALHFLSDCAEQTHSLQWHPNVNLGVIQWHIAVATLFVLLQVALIIGLLVFRAKRLQEEAEAALIADISSKFVNLPASQVDREIEDALRRVCESLNIDRAVLWQWSDVDPDVVMPTHTHCGEGELRRAAPTRQDAYPWAVQQVLAGRTFTISSLKDYPPEAAVDRETCRQLGVKAGMCIPLSVGGEPPVGALGLTALRAERDWPKALVGRLQLVAQVFANALARKRADHALRASEELNRATFEQAAIGIADVGIDGRWLRVNDQLCEIVGYPRDELLKLTFQDITHPEDLEQDRTIVRQFLSGELETATLEKRYFRKDGSTIWVVISASIVRTASGDPLHFIAVIQDVTERRRAEGSARQLSLAVEQSPVLVVVTDLQGSMIYVNRMFLEVTGYSLEECIGRNPRILKSGQTPHSIYKELWDFITSGKTWRGEFHNRKKNGELYWERAIISPLLNAAGEITHYVGVKEDITAEKRTDEAFRAAQAQLEAGTELAGLGYYEVNLGEGTGFMDYRCREICGVPPDVQRGLEPIEFWMEHVHPEDRQMVLDERQSLHEGRIDRISLEYRYSHPSQGQKWIQHVARQRLRDSAGMRTFGVVRDITQQKQAELDVQELRNNLTHLTRVNTVGALSGSLAHELNQPLGIILTNAEAAEELLAQDSPDLAEVQAILSDIVSADRRAAEVIERLRTLVKRGEVSLRPLSLNQVFEDVLHLLHADLIRRGVTVVCDLAPDLPAIAGDRVQLQQLVLNLILNAADAMAENVPGARRLHLQTKLHEGRVCASVRDEGHGLPPEVERLFEAFYTTKPLGLGLGLAICSSIVAAHHGRLWAEPHAERGAVFHFELPVAGTHEQS
jgi:nitrogen fixation negative regulator NifL